MKFKRVLSTGLSAVMAVSCISITAAANTENNSLGIVENEDVTSGGALDTEEAGYAFGSDSTVLKSGTYDIDVSLKNAENTEKDSSAADCITDGMLIVNDDGSARLKIELTSMTNDEQEVRINSWRVYQGGSPSGVTLAAEEIKDENGNITSVEFDIPDSSTDGVYVSIQVESAEVSEDEYLAVNYKSAKELAYYTGMAYTEDDEKITASVTTAGGAVKAVLYETDAENEVLAEELETASEALTAQLSGLSLSQALALCEGENFGYSTEAITEALLSALSLGTEDEAEEDNNEDNDDDNDTDNDEKTDSGDSEDTTAEEETEAVTETETETESITETETVTESATETTTAAATETTTKKSSSSSSKKSSLIGSGSGSSVYVGTSSASSAESDEDEEEEADGVSYTSGYEVRVTIGSSSVVINGKTSTMEAAPYIQTSSSSTLVPLRFVALAILGGSVSNADTSDIVSWDADTRTATIYAGDDVIKFTADSNYMTINGVTSAMSNGVKAEIKDDRMYIPFRALGEALGVEVDWESDTKTAVYIIE
ncbi:MAG: copper amine oxidase N-terminal domain-containing protein [Eubacterium sp.]|nr:copper amine oxidase N-terminal domain-containing protein [Eubacterium sp.]